MKNTAMPVYGGHPSMLKDSAQRALRASRVSRSVERTYCDWITRFHRFSGSPDPSALGPEDVQRFIAHLAGNLRLSPATQREALNALEFLYQDVLHQNAG